PHLDPALASRPVHNAQSTALPIDDLSRIDRYGRERERPMNQHRESRGTRIDEHAATRLRELDALRVGHARPGADIEDRRVVARLEIEQRPLDGAVVPSLQCAGL